MKCEDCKYYVLGKPNAVVYREGQCFRYPEKTYHMRGDWCGEFCSKTVTKKVAKKRGRPTKKKVTKKT